MQKRLILNVGVVVLAIIAGWMLQGCSGDDGEPEPGFPGPDANLVVGDAAPDFTLTNTEGEPVSLGDYRGKPTLLFFHMAVG